jgi:hypothetical protein
VTFAPTGHLSGMDRADAEQGDPDPNLRFFRNEHGAVLTFDRPPTETEARGLTEISRFEAWSGE